MAPVPRLLDSAPLDPQQLIWVHDLDPLSCWHRGNVVLVGDAAHASPPTSGQGASQALIDAVVFAAAIREHGVDDAAFVAFTGARSIETARLTHRGRVTASELFNRA